MINLASVITKGGIVLWCNKPESFSSFPVSEYITDVYIKQNTQTFFLRHELYNFESLSENEFDLIFIAFYPKISSIMRIDLLLEKFKNTFCQIFSEKLSQIQNKNSLFFDFDEEFKKILIDLKSKQSQPRQKTTKNRKKQTQNTKKGPKITVEKLKITQEKMPAIPAALLASKNSKNLNKNRKNALKNTKNVNFESKSGQNLNKNDKKDNKKPRIWADRKLTKKEQTALDFSKPSSKNDKNDKNDKNGKFNRKTSNFVDFSHKNKANFESSSESDFDRDFDSDFEENSKNVPKNVKNVKNGQNYQKNDQNYQKNDQNDQKNDQKNSKSLSIASILSRLTTKKLSEESLQPIISDLERILVDRNVALEVARGVSDSVKAEVIGKTLSAFEFKSSFVKKIFVESLVRIIAPNQPIHLLKEIETSKKSGKPYTIAMVGVNGVGKSTTLAKLAFYLKSRNIKVSIAACDTFRSGAVEQILTHARALDLRVFHKGYAKDAAQVCKNAIEQALKEKDDVVLIDTAGRMQNNEPLMRSLKKLVDVNRPNSVIFVGEALVGNESLDQLKRFKEASGVRGIILTKFDVVDEKIGAAVSLTYRAKLPILFLGTGQTYDALKKANPVVLAKKLING